MINYVDTARLDGGLRSREIAKVGTLMLLWLPLWGQTVIGRHPARTDAAGNQLSIVEERLPERQPDDKRCIPKLQYVLEKSRGGQVISSEAVVVLCKTSSLAECKI